MSFEVLTIYAVVIANLVIGVRLVRKGSKDREMDRKMGPIEPKSVG